MTGIAKAGDYVALYDRFREPTWDSALESYHRAFQHMGMSTVEASHFRFHPLNRFYESVAENPVAVELVNPYMTSGSNAVLHQDARALAISRNVNSKLHFARHGPAFGLPVPRRSRRPGETNSQKKCSSRQIESRWVCSALRAGDY